MSVSLRQPRVVATAFTAVILLAAVVVILLHRGKKGAGQIRQLPDGSTLELRQVILCMTNYNYSHESGGRWKQWIRPVRPVLPRFIENRLGFSGGSFGFGNEGTTNLICITVNRRSEKPSDKADARPVRLQIVDDDGHIYDARWGAHTLGLPGETVNGWQVRAFPKRSRNLVLRFLYQENQKWGTTAEFQIVNPAQGDFPQWQPETWPASKRDGPLAVTLREFESGAVMSQRAQGQNDSAAPRKTRLLFEFSEDGTGISTNWTVQKLSLADATGNTWSPYLDFTRQNLDWTKDGAVEFFGALWPDEKAWKLNLEVVRQASFRPEELWDVTIPLPGPGTVSSLTNQWEHEGVSVQLIGAAAPETDHPGPFKWVAKWWGEDKARIYSLAIQLRPELKRQRLSIVRAADQEGRPVEIVQHSNQDYAQQAVFLRPESGATNVIFTLALQRSRFVEFLVRPQFIDSK